MSDFIIAIKRIIIFLLLIAMTYFLTFFILVNDHSVTVYLNPLFYTANTEITLQVWAFMIASILFGVFITSIISWLYVSKHEKYADSLIKENMALKNRLDRVKKDITKCVE